MLKIYGSRLCPDCVRCVDELSKAGVAFEYHDFSEDLFALKRFLALRDTEPVFNAVRAARKIGIPCIVGEDSRVSLTWEEYL